MAEPFISIEAMVAQVQRLLAALRRRPVSTIEAREELNISHPAGRVMTLRRQGYVIETQRVTAYDHLGRPHTSALYVLKGVPRGR